MDNADPLTLRAEKVFETYRRREYQQAFEEGSRLVRDETLTTISLGPVLLGIVGHLGGLFAGTAAAETATAALKERLAAAPDAMASVRATVGARIREEVVHCAAAQDYRRIGALDGLARLLFPELAPAAGTTKGLCPLAPPSDHDGPESASHKSIPKALVKESEKRSPRPVIVAYCERTHPANPHSRLHEIGPLIVAAMSRYGWQPIFYGLRTLDDPTLLAADWSALLDLCRHHRPDALMVQELRPDSAPDGLMSAFIAALRREVPGIKLTGLYGDPWDRDRWNALTEAARHLDRLWAPFPSLALWQHPALRDKVMTPPFPHEGLGGFSIPAPTRGNGARGLTLSFVGGVDSANWGRGLWLAELKRAGVPVRITVTKRVSDGLPALESYRRYLKTLAATGCALNFSLRADGSRIATGRAFEAILAGALLVQEACPDIDSYFTPGEHFLSFTTVADLTEIGRQLATQAEPLLALRRRAFDFFQEHYRDECIIDHLERQLFTPPAEAPKHIRL